MDLSSFITAEFEPTDPNVAETKIKPSLNAVNSTSSGETQAKRTKTSAVDLRELIRRHVLPALLDDQVIAIPTDTIYGVAARAQSKAAIAKIYAIKGRDEHKPVAICVPNLAQVSDYGTCTLDSATLAKLLPGAVTVVFDRTPKLNPDLNPHTTLVGIRVPDHELTKMIVEELGEPLALTSANRSGDPSCVSASEFAALWPQLGAVVDGGIIEGSRAGSTVVDLSQGGKKVYSIVRDGSALDLVETALKEAGWKPAQPLSA
jgi:tRNA threonylcarbamoyl adenosine modification protein (Sua5/YciO/YrdC/YwlC family)